MILTDELWMAVAAILLTESEPGKRVTPATARGILEAILWIQETGEQWKHLPATFPAQQTCYNRWLIWRKNGALDAALKVLAATD